MWVLTGLLAIVELVAKQRKMMVVVGRKLKRRKTLLGHQMQKRWKR